MVQVLLNSNLEYSGCDFRLPFDFPPLRRTFCKRRKPPSSELRTLEIWKPANHRSKPDDQTVFLVLGLPSEKCVADTLLFSSPRKCLHLSKLRKLSSSTSFIVQPFRWSIPGVVSSMRSRDLLMHIFPVLPILFSTHSLERWVTTHVLTSTHALIHTTFLLHHFRGGKGGKGEKPSHLIEKEGHHDIWRKW